MSTHVLNIGTADPETMRDRLGRAAWAAFNQPPSTIEFAGSQMTISFAQDLTPAQATMLEALAGVTRSAVSLTAEEREAIRPDVAGLIQYQGLAAPTLAQTVQAVKAQSRILRAILRD